MCLTKTNNYYEKEMWNLTREVKFVWGPNPILVPSLHLCGGHGPLTPTLPPLLEPWSSIANQIRPKFRSWLSMQIAKSKPKLCSSWSKNVNSSLKQSFYYIDHTNSLAFILRKIKFHLRVDESITRGGKKNQNCNTALKGYSPTCK